MQADRANTRAGEDTLRRILKRETRESHDRLDAAMGDWPVDSREGYATFLLTQYRARAPIEGWIARALPNTQAPPAQAPLVARDLAELGLALPHSTAFALPQGAEPIGLVWALAGSSLGNRAMLHQRRKIGAAGPERFLADPAMSAFFSGLRARIERPASAELASRAVAGAQAVFSAFLAALTDQTRNTDR